LLEATVTAGSTRSGQYEPLRVPYHPLDVLCQQLLGMAAQHPWSADEALTLVRRAYPYRDLSRGDFSAGHVLRKVFVVQAAATWFVSLPLQVSAVLGPTPALLRPVLIAGVVLWAVGVLFEAVGDHQLRRLKADPANKGVIMDRGLWGWTRHPNYFGDACVWWGLWLASVAAWVSLLTVLSPVLMTYFLVYATGAKLTEKYMRNRPGFAEYRSRTSFFVPMPPRSRLP